MSILVDILNSPGSLHHTLKYFWDYKIDLTSIESRPSSSDSSFKVYIDFAGTVCYAVSTPLIFFNLIFVLNEKFTVTSFKVASVKIVQISC